jgi:hypothetical protein
MEVYSKDIYAKEILLDQGITGKANLPRNMRHGFKHFRFECFHAKGP